MLQIDRHFSTFLYPDMTIEKLQKVATTHVDASFKAKWLRWWNSPTNVKVKNHFPSSVPLKEKNLDDWLNKASFWAQVHLHLFCLLVCLFISFPFLTVRLSLHSWRRALRLRLHRLRTSCPWTLIGIPRRF
jgi:hypothetical protein